MPGLVTDQVELNAFSRDFGKQFLTAWKNTTLKNGASSTVAGLYMAYDAKVAANAASHQSDDVKAQAAKDFIRELYSKDPAFTKNFLANYMTGIQKNADGVDEPYRYTEGDATAFISNYIDKTVPLPTSLAPATPGRPVMSLEKPWAITKENQAAVQHAIDHPLDTAWDWGKKAVRFAADNPFGTVGACVAIAGYSEMKESPIVGTLMMLAGIAALGWQMNEKSKDVHHDVRQRDSETTVVPRNPTDVPPPHGYILRRPAGLD